MVVVMDVTVLHLAVSKLTAALNPTPSQLLWIVDAYAFLIAGTMLLMGTIGDRIGRKRLLIIGAAAFAAASILPALSTSAVEQAIQVAGNKSVLVGGGANILQQVIKAKLFDEIQIDLVPALLGDGIRLFDSLGTGPIELESTSVIESPGVIHLQFRVGRQ